MPAFVFANRAMHAAALPLLDQLGEPVTVLRNPEPGDARPVHVISRAQFERLQPQLRQAGIEIVLVHPPVDASIGETAVSAVLKQARQRTSAGAPVGAARHLS